MSTQPTSHVSSQSQENPFEAIGSDQECRPHFPAEEILNCDVLLGRGKSIHCHPGNIGYRRAIKERCRLYKSKDDAQEKDDIALEVIQSVKDAGGRFLRPVGCTSRWEECAGAVVRTKVKQALRDIIKERRQAAHKPGPEKKSKKAISSPAEPLSTSYRSVDSESSQSRRQPNALHLRRLPIRNRIPEASPDPRMNDQGFTISRKSEPIRFDVNQNIQFPAVVFRPAGLSSVTGPPGVAEASNGSTPGLGAVIAEVAKRRYLDELVAAFQTTSSMPVPGRSLIQPSLLQGSWATSISPPTYHTNIHPGVSPQQELQRVLQSQQQYQHPSALSLPHASRGQIEELLRRLRGGQT